MVQHQLQSRSRARRDLSPAHMGKGRLWQRDYWAVISACRLRPSEVMTFVRHHFADLAPREVAAFTRLPGANGLQLGEEIAVAIRLAGLFWVRVVHCDLTSFTLATIAGHPEAGRITFGAYRNTYRDVIFHIRSRARARSRLVSAAYALGGEPMQTLTWSEFVQRVACSCGDGVLAYVHADTVGLDPGRAFESPETPTFIAQGD